MSGHRNRTAGKWRSEKLLPLRLRVHGATQTHSKLDRFGATLSEFWDDLRSSLKLHQCKYTDCVEVCPVDCFYEGENMLVIHPDEWHRLRRMRSLNARPTPSSRTRTGMEKWLAVNTEYAKKLAEYHPEERVPPTPDFEGEEGKSRKFFSEARARATDREPVST